MNKILLLITSFFFATLALAHASTPSFTELEIHVEEVGFDQTLTLLVLDPNLENLAMEIRDHEGHIVYSASLTLRGLDVLEIDLSDLNSGTYELTLNQGETQKIQRVIMP